MKNKEEISFAMFSDMTNTEAIYNVKLRVLRFYYGYLYGSKSSPCAIFLAIDEQVVKLHISKRS